MGEKKEVKIQFASVICVILVILLLAGCGAIFYLGFSEKNKGNNNEVAEQAAQTEPNKKEEVVKEPTTENDKSPELKFLLYTPSNWMPYKAEKDGKEVSLSEVWGTGIQYGGYLSLSRIEDGKQGSPDNGTYSELIGIYENEDSLKGTYYLSGNSIKFEPNSGEPSYGEISYVSGSDMFGIITKDYNGITVYFRNYNELKGATYEELTSSLDEDEFFYVTDVKDNNDGTYTLFGVIYKRNNSGTGSPVGELVQDSYSKVTVSSSTSIENYYGPEAKTVKEIFADFSKKSEILLSGYANNLNDYAFNLVFSNGKCVDLEASGLGI